MRSVEEEQFCSPTPTFNSTFRPLFNSTTCINPESCVLVFWVFFFEKNIQNKLQPEIVLLRLFPFVSITVKSLTCNFYLIVFF